MTDAQQELGELARLVAGLVEWDLEEGALGYSFPMSEPQAKGLNASRYRSNASRYRSNASRYRSTRPDASVAKEEPAGRRAADYVVLAKSLSSLVKEIRTRNLCSLVGTPASKMINKGDLSLVVRKAAR